MLSSGCCQTSKSASALSMPDHATMMARNVKQVAQIAVTKPTCSSMPLQSRMGHTTCAHHAQQASYISTPCTSPPYTTHGLMRKTVPTTAINPRCCGFKRRLEWCSMAQPSTIWQHYNYSSLLLQHKLRMAASVHLAPLDKAKLRCTISFNASRNCFQLHSASPYNVGSR